MLLAIVAARTIAAATSPASPQWRLTWSDEFNGADGAPPDPAKWNVVSGNGGFGNHELESYTARHENVQQRGGTLAITARHETDAEANTAAPRYTSARLNTQGHFTQAYGRFEARMKLPLGKGLWPAFWLLGNDVADPGWPKCGEIDVMENIGEGARIYSTLHGPAYSGAHGISAHLDLPGGGSVIEGFHLYSVDWEPARIRFYVDATLVAERTPADLPRGATWVYDHPFFLLLNLAVGGDWPGNPDGTTVFPQQMLVDYVRVYQRSDIPAAGERRSEQ